MKSIQQRDTILDMYSQVPEKFCLSEGFLSVITFDKETATRLFNTAIGETCGPNKVLAPTTNITVPGLYCVNGETSNLRAYLSGGSIVNCVSEENDDVGIDLMDWKSDTSKLTSDAGIIDDIVDGPCTPEEEAFFSIDSALIKTSVCDEM